MELRTADYFDNFHCLAGACPQSCCAGWEVVIDPVSVAQYRALPGPLGERLRAALKTEDGEAFFALTDSGRCPFWDEDGLCAIHRALGPEATSEVCRSHPRFIEDYGTLRETTLCASCPEACRLLLASQTPLTFPLTRSEEPGEAPDTWLSPLLVCREKALEILQNRARSLHSRLAELLVFGDACQALLDGDAAEGLPALCQSWDAPKAFIPTPGNGIFSHGWEILSGLEILGDNWAALLRQGPQTVPGAAAEPLLERIAAYFLFRYFLKAMNDGDLLGRVEFLLFSTLTAERLASLVGLPSALRLYCREIEHNEENLATLLTAFRTEPDLGLAAFLRTLKS